MFSYFKIQGPGKMISQFLFNPSLQIYKYILVTCCLKRPTFLIYSGSLHALLLPCCALTSEIPTLALYFIRLKHSASRIVQCIYWRAWSLEAGIGVGQVTHSLAIDRVG